MNSGQNGSSQVSPNPPSSADAQSTAISGLGSHSIFNQQQHPSSTAGTGISPPSATHAAQAGQNDSELEDEGYDDSSRSSFTSVASDSKIRKGVSENGRLYPYHGRHSYGLPIDYAERQRLNLQHFKYLRLLQGKLFLAPIHPTPQRILDLGTGTGIWAEAVADMYPSAEVIGVDIAVIQSTLLPVNCVFEVDDVEDDWAFRENHFDFIHSRDFVLSIRDWPRLIAQSFRHLRPGGWCELACIHPLPCCDDGTMPDDSGFPAVCALLREASEKFGATLDAPLNFESWLRDAGFDSIGVHRFRIHASGWSNEPKVQEIGNMEERNIDSGAQAFGLRIFSHAFGWSKERTELELFRMRRDAKNQQIHQYTSFIVVYGQKPSR